MSCVILRVYKGSKLDNRLRRDKKCGDDDRPGHDNRIRDSKNDHLTQWQPPSPPSAHTARRLPQFFPDLLCLLGLKSVNKLRLDEVKNKGKVC
jgi:hypothetical protein